jgi:metal-responsive CopG/Arc/MetJ family transcriptional regulator
MPKVKIDSHLYQRAKKAAETAGYPGLNEFVTHLIEKELAQLETTEQDDEKVAQQLRGLGYIE